PRRGDHPVDDAARAAEPADHRRLAPQAHRDRLRHERAAGEPAAAAAQADEEDDEAARVGQDAGDAAAPRRGRRAAADAGARRTLPQARKEVRGMAVKIRLTRIGSKKNPVYRVVVADARAPRDGRAIETIGRYNPQLNPSLVEIDADKARAWLDKGAQPTEPVQKHLKIAGV